MTSWTLAAKLEREDLFHFARKIVCERRWQLYDGKVDNVSQRTRLRSVRNGLWVERKRHIELREVDSYRKVRGLETGSANFRGWVILQGRMGGWMRYP